MKKDNIHCMWCGRTIHHNKTGRTRKYCSQACRQRSYEARNKLTAVHLPADSVVLSREESTAIIDRIFQVRCSAEDLLIAVNEGASSLELKSMAQEIVNLSTEAERLR